MPHLTIDYKLSVRQKNSDYGTAGFGGTQEYYEKILQIAQLHLDASNTVIGVYMCQYKMPMTIRQRYKKMLTGTSEDLNFKDQIDNFDRAMSHPYKNDCDKVNQQVIKLYMNMLRFIV